MIKKLRSLILFFALLIPLHAADVLTYLPQDAAFAFTTADAKTFGKLHEHPIFKAIFTPEIKAVFAPLLADMEESEKMAEKIFNEETGMGREKIMAQFGEFAAAVRIPISSFAEFAEKNPGKLPLELFAHTMAIQFKGDEAAAEKTARAYVRLIKHAVEKERKKNPDRKRIFPSELEESVDEHEGVKAHIWKSKDGDKESDFPLQISWAYCDQNIVISATRQGLFDAIDRSKKGAASFADNANFRSLAERTKGADFVGFLDLRLLITDGLKLAAEKAPNPDMVKAVAAALGVNQFRAAYMMFDLTEQALDAEFGITFEKKPALLDIVAMDGPGFIPNFIPADAESAAYGTFHWDRVLPAVEKILAASAPPMLEMLNAQLLKIKETTSVDLRKDILSNLGPDLWTATASATEGALNQDPEDVMKNLFNAPQIIGVKLRDRKAFELAINSLINKLAPGQAIFEEREIHGFTIKNFKAAPMPVGFIIADDWLIIGIGEQMFLEKILARIKTPSGGGVFDLPEVKAAISTLPADDDGTSYADFGNVFAPLFEILRKFPVADGSDGLSEILDLKKLPKELKIPLLLVSRNYLDEQAFRIRIHIAKKAK